MLHFRGMEIVSLTSLCGQNLPGLQTIEYVPTHWVDAATWRQVYTSGWMWQYEFELIEGASWLTASVLPRPNWNEQGGRTVQGQRHTGGITAYTPRMRPAAQGVLAAMLEPRWLLRLTDRQGMPWLVGTLEHPCEFGYTATSGGQGRGSGYELRWSSEAATAAAGYQPEL